VSPAAARDTLVVPFNDAAGLEQIQTEVGHARISALGQCLAEGLDAAFAGQGLDRRAHHFGPRVSFAHAGAEIDLDLHPARAFLPEVVA
jgi:glutamate-1-semialdehyde aminotransferase